MTRRALSDALAQFRLNRITTRHWRQDLRGGLYAAAVALPMGLAFGVASGLGPVAGIYSAVCTGIFAALFGGTATQISGPTGPIAILMASVAASFAGQPAAIAGVVLLAGALQIVFGALQLGRYISLVPYPVTSGFATAVGCIIITMQLNPALGLAPVGDTVTAVRELPGQIAAASPAALAIAALCALACALAPGRLRSVVPVHLAVLLAGSAIVGLVGLDVPFLAAPDSLLPEFEFPPLLELPWTEIWVAAVVLALVSSLDSLLTSVAADSATQQFHDSDRELVGQGLGNLFAAMIGALPGSGSTFRTLANIRGGGQTPLSALIHSLALLTLLLLFGQLISFIPASVLAGILIYIGLGIIDWKYISRFLFVPRGGVLIMITVWFVALFVNVVTGAAIGFVMACLGYVKRMADIQLEAIDVSDEAREESLLNEDERAALERAENKTLLINFSGPVTFGAANRLYRRLANIAAYRAIVLDFSDVPLIDESGIIALENIIRAAKDHDQLVLLAGLSADLARSIVRFGLTPLLKECPRHRERLEALEAAAKHALEE
ncbi:MAG TPA: SulP family inorganic anion transporter [Gammaproteobacteria bacterium]